MGAGKTTVGRRLAVLRGMEFVDVDDEVEHRTGVDIPFIFEKEGEAGFRAREHAALADLSQHSNLIIATGGGAVTLAENRQILATRGLVIYLAASLEQQIKRTRRSRKRPLLYNTDPKAKLAALFQERDPLYREVADFVVPSTGKAVRHMAQQLNRILIDSGHP